MSLEPDLGVWVDGHYLAFLWAIHTLFHDVISN